MFNELVVVAPKLIQVFPLSRIKRHLEWELFCFDFYKCIYVYIL